MTIMYAFIHWHTQKKPTREIISYIIRRTVSGSTRPEFSRRVERDGRVAANSGTRTRRDEMRGNEQRVPASRLTTGN